MKPIFLNYIKTYFTFSKGERNGIVFLLIVLAVIIVSIKFIPKKESSPEDFILLQREVDSLYQTNIPVQVNQKKIIYHENKTYTQKKQENNLTIELNASDSSSLINLPGIGPVYASRIIKYKNLLGGYYHINQLKEVYGLKEENLIKAVPHISVNSGLITAILVDTATFKILARHPYIGKDRAWKIINFRDKSKTGGITADDLKNTVIFDSIQWERVKHYLKF